MRRFLGAIAGFFLLSTVVWAQEEDDRGFLTRTIENALSSAGRDVRIDGFRGALSSEAAFDRMVIEDDDGIWLTLEDVQLVWSRLALLRGRLEVERLSARLLKVDRLPATEEAEELPSAEASGFSFKLPELPVSVNIETFEVTEIDLGAPILGAPARLSVTASAVLNDAGLDLNIDANRIDDVNGEFRIDANVERSGSEITLELALVEDAGGIAANLMGLPGDPSVALDVSGEGPLDDFVTQIALATDGADRLSGQVTLTAETDAPEGQSPDRRILADLSGDITALIAPEYEDFFGPNVSLNVDTILRSGGAIDVNEFAVTARALDLKGAVRLNSDKWPVFIDVEGALSRDGQPVVLPGSDAGVTVQTVLLDVDYDVADNDALKGTFDISGLKHDALTVERTLLTLDGVLRGDVGTIGQLLADVEFDASGIALTDATASRALGRSVTGGANIAFVEDTPIRISNITLTGADYGLQGQVIVQEPAGGFPTQLDVTVQAQDLERFAELAGQPLSGSARLGVSGRVTPLAGTFDLRVTGNTQDLAVEIPQADAVLAGLTTLALQAVRDETGTFVRDLTLENDAINVAADASLRSLGSDVTAQIKLNDIGLVVPQYQGAVELDANARQTVEGWVVRGRLDAPYDSQISVDGLATGPDADIRFALNVADVEPFAGTVSGPLAASGRVRQSPDGYLVDVEATGPHEVEVAVEGLATGPKADVEFALKVPQVQPFASTVSGSLDAQGRVRQSPDGYVVDVTADGPYQSEVAVQGLATGPKAAVRFQAALPNIAVFVPDLSGPLSLDGMVARAEDRWQVDTDVTGPLGTTAAVDGTVAADGTDLDLAVVGALPLGLTRPFLAPRDLSGQAQFDLAVRGAPGLNAVSGRITTSGARFTAPNLRIGLTDLAAAIDLNGGSARVDANAGIAAGGNLSVNGAINLTSLAADLDVALRNAVLTDPRLYAATLNGDVSVDGPLTGGARIAGTINLSEVNVTVPATGLTSIGEIPPIQHVGSPAAAASTRARAGVQDQVAAQAASSNAGPAYPLAITIRAPSRIFVRGRGINAELGGALEITGNTNNIISAGSFDLVRGRLDIIGKRFELDEGSVQFQGSVTPYILFVTTTSIPDGTASITVEGIATEPEITFSAVPEAPQDEVLSLILFGRKLSELSAFQTIQLVNGLAQLSGRGGVGFGNAGGGLGLDELDVTTTASGATEVTAGKYISDTIYTDVTTSAENGTDISLNIDLTDSLTAKATAGSEGNSSIGIFFERDY